MMYFIRGIIGYVGVVRGVFDFVCVMTLWLFYMRKYDILNKYVRVLIFFGYICDDCKY